MYSLFTHNEVIITIITGFRARVGETGWNQAASMESSVSPVAMKLPNQLHVTFVLVSGCDTSRGLTEGKNIQEQKEKQLRSIELIRVLTFLLGMQEDSFAEKKR